MAYRGIVARLPVGAQGFTGTRNPSQAGPGHLTYTDGAELNAGVIQKEGGATRLNSVALGVNTHLVSSMLFDGANAATTFVDSASAIRVWTAVGQAQLSTAQKKFGTASLLLDGTDDKITTPDAPDLHFLDKDFTIYTFFYTTATIGTVRYLFGQRDVAGTTPSLSVQASLDATGKMVCQVAIGPSTIVTITGTTVYNAVGWHYFALCREGSVLRMFLDGVQEGGDVAITGSVNTSTQLFSIGGSGALTTNTWMGNIDYFNIEIGLARYIADFTPPTTAIPGVGTGFGYTPACVLAGINWSPVASVTKDYVFLEGGFVLSDDGSGAFATTLRLGLESPEEPPPYFCAGGGEVVGTTRKLFMFSANNPVQYTEGNSGVMQNISVAPADWATSGPITGCYHAFRMWGAGNASDPHRLYYSKPDDHKDFTAGTVAVFPGEGEGIMALYSFRGALLIWKYPAGIYTLDTQDPVPSNWQLIKLTDAVGTVSPHGVTQIENDVIFLDRHMNIHLLSTINELGDINTSNISKAADLTPFIKDNIALSHSRRANALWYPLKRQVWFGLSTLGASYNDLRLVLSFEGVEGGQGQFPARFFMSRRDAMAAVWLRPDPVSFIPKPAASAPNGFIYLLDTDTRDKVGAAYQMRFVTSQIDFSYIDQAIATRTKNGQFLELTSEPRGDWDLIVDTFWDGKYTDTIFFDMGGLGGVLGNFTLGVDKLGAQSITSRRRRLVGSGRRLRLDARNDGLGQDVVMTEFWAQFTVGDERDTSA